METTRLPSLAICTLALLIAACDSRSVQDQNHVEPAPVPVEDASSSEAAPPTTFTLPAYGFTIGAVTSKNCTWKDLGPNSAKQRMDAGEEISPTIPPATTVVSFDCSDEIPDFSLFVYEKHKYDASMDGACGTQFASSNVMSRYLTPDGGPTPSYFEVIQNLPEGGQQADYCFDAGGSTMITLRWNIQDSNSVIGHMETVADSVRVRK